MKRAIPRPLVRLCEPAYHFLLAFLAAVWYRFPSRRLVVIGVTGTKGKTTAVELLHEILSASGAKTASVSSLRFRIGAEDTPNLFKMTMPGRFFLQGFLRRAVRAKCRFAVIEVTSQGITQFRHRFIRFSGALVTNVAPEHIEAHGSFERYLRAKLDLFWRLPKDAVAVINRDDPERRRFAAATAAHRAFYNKEGIAVNGRRWAAADLSIGQDGIGFTLGGQSIRSLLRGEFNFYNILGAASLGLSQGIALEKIAAGIARVAGVPGRMEYVARDPFAAVVDYAHTPDSLKSVYAFLSESRKPKTKNQKLICVLGSAGGGRDKWKRPELGRIAAEFCSEVILTNEDPYDESPAAIMDEIAAGFPQTQNSKPKTRKIVDRREAIRAALRLAAPGDIVVITGKGAEPWLMGPDGTKIPWDDREAAREALRDLPLPPPRRARRKNDRMQHEGASSDRSDS